MTCFSIVDDKRMRGSRKVLGASVEFVCKGRADNAVAELRERELDADSALEKGKMGRTSILASLDDESTHRVNDDSRSARVDPAAEGKEVSLDPRSTKVVPEPTRWTEAMKRKDSEIQCQVFRCDSPRNQRTYAKRTYAISSSG
jgi:hypothetical protein